MDYSHEGTEKRLLNFQDAYFEISCPQVELWKEADANGDRSLDKQEVAEMLKEQG